MSVWEKEPIPLFWHNEEPIVMYILKDKVVRCFQPYGGVGEFNPIVSFNMLLQLYKHPIIVEQLPKELLPVFEGMEPYPEVSEMYHHFAGANDPHGYTSYLDLKIKVQEENDQFILFYDISYRGEPLKETFELPILDAFYLIANSCANTRISRIQEIIQGSFEPSFHLLPKEKVSEQVEQIYYLRYKKGKAFASPEWRAKLVGGVNLHEKYYGQAIDRFVIEYLAYLNKLIMKKQLDPFKLLRLSGTRALAFLLSDEQPYNDFLQEFFGQLTKISELTAIQKLVYYTFMEVAEYSEVVIDKRDKKTESLFLKLNREHAEAKKRLYTHLKKYLPLWVKEYLEKK